MDLLELPEESITFEDSAFLWARQGYLTEEEKKRYSKKFDQYREAVEAEYEKEQTEGDPDEKPLIEFTRKELNAMAKDIYNIEKPEEMLNKLEVIKAIETAKASKAE